MICAGTPSFASLHSNPSCQTVSNAFFASKKIETVGLFLTPIVDSKYVLEKSLLKLIEVEWFFRKPVWKSGISLLSVKYFSNLGCTIDSRIFPIMGRREIGLYERGSPATFPFFNNGTKIASFHILGNSPDLHISLYNSRITTSEDACRSFI